MLYSTSITAPFIVLIMLLIAGNTAVMAATITPGDPTNVYFSVNSGGYYVSSIPIVGSSASSTIPGSFFELTAQGPSYSDAGIVLYYLGGGFQLGSLSSVVVNANMTVAINLWFDTGHDGTFFSVDSGGLLTSLNNDSYASSTGNTLTADTIFYMQAGPKAGSNFTLADFQSGKDPGIDGNIRAALWIGITSPNSSGTNIADITSVDVTIPEPATEVLLGAGLIALGVAAWRRRK